MEVVQEWLHQHADLTLKVEMGELKLELSIAGPTERAELPDKLQRLKSLSEEDSEEDSEDESAADSDDDDDDDDSEGEADTEAENDDDSGDSSKDDFKAD